MKFTKILNKLITEAAQSKYLINLEKVTKSRKDKEGNKIKPFMSKEEYDELVQGDPTTNLNDIDLSSATPEQLEQVKAGKYVPWLIKQYLTLTPDEFTDQNEPGYQKALKEKKRLFMEDLYKVTNDLKKYERFKSRLPQDKKDINSIGYQELYDLVKDFSLEKTKASAEEKKSAVESYEYPGSKVDFRGEKWTVVKIEDKGPLGKDAACFFGGYHLEPSKGETKWCTSSPGYNWFERYIDKGPLYVVIPNNWTGKRGEKSGLPAQRYQFHFQDAQFMDPHDHQIDLIQFLNTEGSEMKQYFKPEFVKGLTTGDGTSLVIENFERGAVGKFVALYGLSEVFENLPLSIKEISIVNNNNNDLVIEVPDSISRFTNLETLYFSNCITGLPDSICELKKLRFISILKNPNLTSLPDCIINLPKLCFINAKDSGFVPSEEQSKHIFHLGDGFYDKAGED